MNFNKNMLAMIALVGVISIMTGATAVHNTYAQGNST